MADLYWKLKSWIERTERIVNSGRSRTAVRIEATRLGGHLVQVARGLIQAST
ncbi:MAG: hypothetical protein ACE5Z5_12360 [Candidatus Bathyarchaeia archaeon]